MMRSCNVNKDRKYITLICRKPYIILYIRIADLCKRVPIAAVT